MKKNIGYGFFFLIAVGALAFEMTESFNFWTLAFPAEKWFLGYLGFFLTSIAALGYFFDFLYVAGTKTQRTVALGMTIVTMIAAVLTAGIGFQISAFEQGGFAFSKDELELMALGIQILVGLHMFALLIYVGGDAVAQAWRDDDNDGIPNWRDKKNDKPKNQPTAPAPRQFASEAEEIAALQKRLDELNPTNAGK